MNNINSGDIILEQKFFKKYLLYKKKYNKLKIQHGGLTKEAKAYVIKKIFNNLILINRYFNQFKLLKLIFEKLELNISNCDLQDNKRIEFQICELNKQFKIIPNDNAEIIENYKHIKKLFSKNLAAGEYGKIFTGKLNKDDVYSSLIKVPINIDNHKLRIGLINEAYINLCIINDIILDNCYSSNLIFTFGLLFLPECKSFKIKTADCNKGPFNINLIQNIN